MTTEPIHRKPTVLAITHDPGALRELRIVMPLSVLKEQGYIRDYAVTDPHLRRAPDDFAFDTLWLQRIEDITFLRSVVDCMGDQFVYDLDDLLLAKPGYVRFPRDNSDSVAYALQQCGLLTAPSQRLVSLLEKYSGLRLASKAITCPNGNRFPHGLRIPAKPVGIIWSSSDYLALTNSREAVIGALTRFAKRHDLPVYCFGYLGNSFTSELPRVVDCGFISFWHYKALFAAYPLMIGVAPLETQCDPETLDFINGKSDVKLIDFVGFGHPCVYSDAPPYIDADLPVGIKAENTEEAWAAALEEAYASKWRDIAREQEAVISCRDMAVLAQRGWLQAIRNVQQPSLVSVRTLRQALHSSVRKEVRAVIYAALETSPRLRGFSSKVPRSFKTMLKRFLAS